MFDRFTQTARAVFVDAQEQARRVHHQEILAEHLLLAVLADDACTSQQVLRDHGVQPARLVDEMPALGPGDRDALKEIGIDLAAVRRRAEAAFGAGALDRPRPRRRGLLRRRTSTGGLVPFSAAAKRALEQSLRQALALRHREITVDHACSACSPTTRTRLREPCNGSGCLPQTSARRSERAWTAQPEGARPEQVALRGRLPGRARLASTTACDVVDDVRRPASSYWRGCGTRARRPPLLASQVRSRSKTSTAAVRPARACWVRARVKRTSSSCTTSRGVMPG